MNFRVTENKYWTFFLKIIEFITLIHIKLNKNDYNIQWIAKTCMESTKNNIK